MTKIVQLPQDLINKIAAGEVIERPANVVKELVENSIDAKSTKIFIEVKNAGKSLISVEDNGEGMSREDAILSLKKHATSKIRSAEDLFHILTFGFRGEALASISSVSKFEMITSDGNECTRIVKGDSGDEKVLDCHAEKGTKIVVKDLFFNIPARKKYLKTNNVEFKHIVDYVMRYALVYPKIFFKLIHNGRTIIDAPSVNTLKEKIALIFGLNYAKNSIEVSFEEEGVNVSGFVSNKNITRKSKEDLYIFVNHRPVKNAIIEQAIKDAYGNYLMRQEWPFVVLDIVLKPEELDVNVHPRKEEVKFVSEEKVYGAVFSAIKLELTKSKQFKTYQPKSHYHNQPLNSTSLYNFSSSNPPNQHSQFTEIHESAEDYKSDNLSGDFETSTSSELRSDEKIKRESTQNSNVQTNDVSNLDPRLVNLINKVKSAEGKLSGSKISEGGLRGNIKETRGLEKATEHSDQQEKNRIRWPEFLELNYLGQFYNTYLVFTSSYDLWLFDQHLVEERYNYEQLKFKKITSQNLLEPITINLTYKDLLLISDSLDYFKQAGFDIDVLGNSVIVRAVPSIIKSYSTEQKERIIKDIVDEFVVIKRTKKLENLQDEMLKSVACKASVKAGTKLNPYRVKVMISNLATCKEPYTCPHGRPVIVKFNVNAIHRMFNRK